MQYNIIDTNNKKYKIISINGKNNNKFLMNILIGFNIKNLENNNLNELINDLKKKLNKKISKKNNNKFNKFNKSHLNILEKTLNVNLIIYDNNFNKLYSGKNKSNNKIELIKKGNSYNVLIKNIKKNSKIIQKGGEGEKGREFIEKVNNQTTVGEIINGYQNCGVYSIINKYIRDGIIEPGNDFENILNKSENQNEKEVIYIKKLDNIINTNKKYNNYLYRGIPFSLINKILGKNINEIQADNIELNNIFNLAYTSSSTNITKASEFAGDGGIIIKFIIPNGIKYHEMKNEGENEILIQRGTQFTNMKRVRVTNETNNVSNEDISNNNDLILLDKKNQQLKLWTADIKIIDIDNEQIRQLIDNLNRIETARKSFANNEINKIKDIKTHILKEFKKPFKKTDIINYLKKIDPNLEEDNTENIVFELGLEIDIICDENCNSKKNC